MPLDLEAIEKRWTDSDPYSLQLMPTRARLEDVDDLITEVRALRAALTEAQGKMASAIDMIENCAGRPSNPDALVNMLLAHLKATTDPVSNEDETKGES